MVMAGLVPAVRFQLERSIGETDARRKGGYHSQLHLIQPYPIHLIQPYPTRA